MTRKECLDAAAGCVLQDRASQYGGVEDNFARIAKLWSVYTGTVLDGIDVAMMMALLKVARIRGNKTHADSFVDLAGYAACGAELAGRAEAYRQSIEKAGAEYKRLRAEAEAQPEFNPGDRVEALSFDGSRWEDAVVERTEFASGQWHCTVRLASGERHCLPVAGSIRRPSRAGDKAGGSHPENPDSSTAAQPKFKHGDSLLVTMPDGEDIRCIYVGESTHPGCCCVRYLGGDYSGDTDDTVPTDQLRRVPVSKAEGCEALVEKDAPLCGERCEEFIPGLGTCEGCHHAREHDAPQTPAELYDKIIASNPATFGRPRTPTGEELAEMAEEDEEHE